MDVTALRRARLELAYARTSALLAAVARRRCWRERHAADLRAVLAEVDRILAELERDAWDE